MKKKITNKFRFNTGIRDLIISEKPVYCVVHYIMNYSGVPIEDGLDGEYCLNIIDAMLYYYHSNTWSGIDLAKNEDENNFVEYAFLFAGTGNANAGNGINIPDMKIYEKIYGEKFNSRYANDGVTLLVKNASLNFEQNSLLAYDKDTNTWTLVSGSGEGGGGATYVEGEGIDLIELPTEEIEIAGELATTGLTIEESNRGISAFTNESFTSNDGFVQIWRVDAGYWCDHFLPFIIDKWFHLYDYLYWVSPGEEDDWDDDEMSQFNIIKDGWEFSDAYDDIDIVLRNDYLTMMDAKAISFHFDMSEDVLDAINGGEEIRVDFSVQDANGNNIMISYESGNWSYYGYDLIQNINNQPFIIMPNQNAPVQHIILTLDEYDTINPSDIILKDIRIYDKEIEPTNILFKAWGKDDIVQIREVDYIPNTPVVPNYVQDNTITGLNYIEFDKSVNIKSFSVVLPDDSVIDLDLSTWIPENIQESNSGYSINHDFYHIDPWDKIEINMGDDFIFKSLSVDYELADDNTCYKVEKVLCAEYPKWIDITEYFEISQGNVVRDSNNNFFRYESSAGWGGEANLSLVFTRLHGLEKIKPYEYPFKLRFTFETIADGTIVSWSATQNYNNVGDQCLIKTSNIENNTFTWVTQWDKRLINFSYSDGGGEGYTTARGAGEVPPSTATISITKIECYVDIISCEKWLDITRVLRDEYSDEPNSPDNNIWNGQFYNLYYIRQRYNGIALNLTDTNYVLAASSTNLIRMKNQISSDTYYDRGNNNILIPEYLKIDETITNHEFGYYVGRDTNYFSVDNDIVAPSDYEPTWIIKADYIQESTLSITEFAAFTTPENFNTDECPVNFVNITNNLEIADLGTYDDTNKLFISEPFGDAYNTYHGVVLQLKNDFDIPFNIYLIRVFFYDYGNVYNSWPGETFTIGYPFINETTDPVNIITYSDQYYMKEWPTDWDKSKLLIKTVNRPFSIFRVDVWTYDD